MFRILYSMDILFLIIIGLVFSSSCFFLIKKCIKDQANLSYLTSNVRVAPVECIEIIESENIIQPSVPELPINN